MALAQLDATPEVPAPSDVEDAVLANLDALDAPEQLPDGRWHIHDDDQADWALRKLARAHAALEQVRRTAERQKAAVLAAVAPWLEEIEHWAEERSTVIGREVQGFESLLLTYHRASIEEDPSRLTIKLPHGELRSRKSPDRWTFGQEFVAWARTYHPELLREEVDKPAAKKALSIDDASPTGISATITHPETGEITRIPVLGVAIEKGERNYTVEVAK